jgi:peptidoglycan/LPS O-acetylase OafA/YrhL
MTAHKEFHIPSLDGIRGLAALTVFVSHAMYRDIVPGGFGVTVFFFLSGYLITTLLRTEHEQTGQIRFGKFYLRRVYRIIPPMYIVLTCAVLLALGNIVPDRMKLDAVVAQYAHLTNYYYIFFGHQSFAPATSVMWSLAVEEHFYLLFPLLISILLRYCNPRRTAAILLGICMLVLAWRCYLILGVGVGHRYTYYATDTRLDSILYGCIMGVWCNPALDRDQVRVGRNAWIGIMILSVGLLLFSFLYRSPVFRETARYSVQGVALFSLFFVAVRYHHWPIFSWLETRPMRAMGLISYTFYLTHVPCLLLLRLYLDVSTPVRALLGFIATTTVSTLMYVLVERHMGTLRRRLHENRGREKPAAKIGDAVSTVDTGSIRG